MLLNLFINYLSCFFLRMSRVLLTFLDFTVILGAPALTSREFKEKDFEQTMDFLDEAVQISIGAQSQTGLGFSKTKSLNQSVKTDVVQFLFLHKSFSVLNRKHEGI